jgi:hypothetical protein
MDDLSVHNETKNIEEFLVYEKSDVVKQVAAKVDDALSKMETPAILIKGGPGVGKSTASYESLDYLKKRGYKTIEVMPEQLSTEKARNRIADMGPNSVLFIDSIDAVLSDESSASELSQTIDLIKKLKKEDNCPIIMANIHDPYLVNNRLEDIHAEKRPLLLGKDGLFENPDNFVQVNDECTDDFSVNTAITKATNTGKLNQTWIPFLQSELKKLQIKSHSIISNVFSEIGLVTSGDSLPSMFTNEYSSNSQESAEQWLEKRVGKVKSNNETYRRAYYEPDHPDETFKGLVRHNV